MENKELKKVKELKGEKKMSKTIYKEVVEIIEEIVDKYTLWRIMNTLMKKSPYSQWKMTETL